MSQRLFLFTWVIAACSGSGLFTPTASEAAVVISEFLASNATGLADEDGDHPDWIELFNSGPAAVNLNGWFLTDSAANLSKWRLPATNLPPGGFQIVFASGKNRAVAGAPLHANFSLNADGEYLALVMPDGLTITSEFTPVFPTQLQDVSFGTAQNVLTTLLVSNSSPARIFIPSNDVGIAWISNAFNDLSWLSGTNGIGYQAFVPGFAVRNIRANIGVCDLGTAENVLASPSLQSSSFTATPQTINYVNTGGGANFGGDLTFPGMTINADENNFVLEATGIITIPTSGFWTFGVNSDDGFSVSLGSNIFSYPSPRGPADTVAAFNLVAGDYPVRLVFYECGGGAEVEFYAAAGNYGSFNGAFRLVGDTAGGGLAVKSLPGASGGANFRPLITTDLQPQMYNRYRTAYVRLPFSVTDATAFSSLKLRMKYDDGFVAYLNGVEVARRNAPTTPIWSSAATLNRSNSLALAFEEIDLTPSLGLLANGPNLLAIHGLNDSTGSGEFLQRVELGEYKVVGSTNHYFSTPTPGSANSSDTFAFVNNLKFTPGRGWFTNAVSVTITSATPGIDIRYTLDGSAPDASLGTLYTGAITLSNTTTLRAVGFRQGFESTVPETHTYMFLDQVLRQTGAGFPMTWAGVTPEYTLDPAIVNDPQWAPTIKSDLLSIPTLSIAMNVQDLFGPGGIYVNTGSEGVAWERPCSLEYMRPDGKKGFQINCGIRVQGGASRGAMRKHGLRVLFKNVYGAGKLDYDLYPDSPVKEFDTLTLHGAFNDHWGWVGAPAQLQRDQWCRDSQNAMGGFGPHGTYVHLYLDGLYWGLYNIGEKGDGSFASHFLGGDKEEYDAFNSDEVIDGDTGAWSAMFAIANAGITTDLAYTNLSQYLDIPNFIDYMLMNFYAGNTDWPGHNWNAARRRAPGAGFHFFSWDAEWVFGIGASSTSDLTGTTGGSPGTLYNAARAHPEFRRLFGDRAQKHLFNNGALTPAACDARWMRRADEINRAIVPETARWGYGNNRNTWLSAQTAVRSWFPQRTSLLITQLRNAGLYPQLDAPLFAPVGGLVPPGYPLALTNPNPSGTVYYTTDGSDPRLWGGAASPAANLYAAPLLITNATVLRTRVRDGVNWSALVEATFYAVQDFSALAITEIMYRPPAFAPWSSDDLEFVELRNSGTQTLDLSGLLFTSGLDFAFTNGTRLAPGAFFVLARNAAAFNARYPGVAISGLYSNKLDNAGETITLSHVLNTNVFSVTYDNGTPWPITPDGLGFSLVRSSLAGDPDAPSSWRASTSAGGSPGTDDPAPNIPAIVINEVLTHTDLPAVDAIELHNPGPLPVDIGGWFLTDDAVLPKKYRIPAPTLLPAGGYKVFTEADFNPMPGVPPSFSLNALGEQLHLFSGDAATTNLTGYSHSIEFGAAARNVTFGRRLISTGDENWVAQLSSTLGAPNSGPLVGPVVINEIMYHPPPGHDEFVELYNLSAAPVALWDPGYPTNTWRLNGLAYSFSNTVSIPSGGYLLLVSSDPTAFRSKYNVPLATQILGPFAGALQDSGERLRIERPDSPLTNTVPYVVVDEVRYNDRLPWPLSPDGEGPSLQRRAPALYGNEPTNWFASGITPGETNSFNQPPAVALITPTNGSSFTAPATVNLTALASDSDGTIIQVEFFDADISIGVATNSPYQLAWFPAPVGTHTVVAKARDNRLAVTVSAPITIQVTPPPLGNGIGLRGDYFDNADFTGIRVRRVDPTVSFDWGSGQPDAAIGADTFSVRWTGSVQPRFSETFTFYTVSDDGVRLWVNNQLLVDNWTDHAPTENSGIIALQGGVLYDIRMEMYESGGGATAQLLWSSPSVPKEFIPATQLYPPVTSNLPPVISLSSPTGGVFVSGATLIITANATDPDGAIFKVEFYAGATKLGEDTTAPYAFAWANIPAGQQTLRVIATDDSALMRTSAPVSIMVVAGFTSNVTLIATGSVWRYLDTGVDPGGGWTASAFNDAAWNSGPAQLGYGDGDERTTVGFGPNSGAKYITTWFRQAFVVPDVANFASLNLRVLRDDGIVLYLNGSELFRDNMPAGAVNSGTPSLLNIGGADESTFYGFPGNPGYLLPGMNLLAAEVHQSSGGSSDLSFDFELTGVISITAPNIVVQPASQSVLAGQTATFNVGVDGSQPMGFQWRFNNSPLPGATNTILSLSAAQPANSGNYAVVITNAAGSVTSLVATLTVTNPDTDGDGMPDWWELATGTNPNLNDAAKDPDADGMTNLAEYIAGTDPYNASSFLRIDRITGITNTVQLEFQAVSNRTYSIQFKNTVTDLLWTKLADIPARPSNRLERVSQTSTNPTHRLYRLATPSVP